MRRRWVSLIDRTTGTHYSHRPGPSLLSLSATSLRAFSFLEAMMTRAPLWTRAVAITCLKSVSVVCVVSACEGVFLSSLAGRSALGTHSFPIHFLEGRTGGAGIKEM